VKRIFWMAVGAGLTVAVVVKGRELMARATPAGISAQAQQKGRELTARVSEFLQTVREAADEREAELRDELGLPDETDARGPVHNG